MSSQAQALECLQEYARTIKEKEYNLVDSHGDEAAYEARLNKTLTHLKDQVQREQNTLQTVSS
jgi:biopolymer transport protein ExbB/TolQ